MLSEDMLAGIEQAAPDFVIESSSLEGEGDFCTAYTVNRNWIFRFAYNDEGSRALEREIKLLPRLASRLSLPIPNITYSGVQPANGLLYVAYPKIEGTQLTRAILDALNEDEQEQCASDLAHFLRSLRAISAEEVLSLGVPLSDYPFCRTEEGIIEGSAEEIYAREGERITLSTLLDSHLDEPTAAAVRAEVGRLVKSLIADKNIASPLAPVHGDLSGDHILFDEETHRIRGIIDFSDVIVTTPLLDLAYLHGVYGPGFTDRVLEHYGVDSPGEVKRSIDLLGRWHNAMRLLWALDHEYERGIKRWGRELVENVG